MQETFGPLTWVCARLSFPGADSSRGKICFDFVCTIVEFTCFLLPILIGATEPDFLTF